MTAVRNRETRSPEKGTVLEGIRLTFTLPSGSYATILLRELMKCANVDEQEPAS